MKPETAEPTEAEVVSMEEALTPTENARELAVRTLMGLCGSNDGRIAFEAASTLLAYGVR